MTGHVHPTCRNRPLLPPPLLPVSSNIIIASKNALCKMHHSTSKCQDFFLHGRHCSWTRWWCGQIIKIIQLYYKKYRTLCCFFVCLLQKQIKQHGVLPCEEKYAQHFLGNCFVISPWNVSDKEKNVAVGCGCSLAIMCNHVEEDIFV